MANFNARSGAMCFQHRGARASPRALLIHGLGCQLAQWPDRFVNALAASGLCVVTFDNRDAGLSHGPEDVRAPSPEALLAAQQDASVLTPAYSLSDMAADAIDLLDHLGQAGAHVIGFSMGGMIAQRMAVEYPERVYSLTSLMSSNGDPSLPEPREEAVRALLALLATETTETAIAHMVRAWQTFGGEHFDSERLGLGRFARAAIERAYRPDGIARQLAAILADGDRGPLLATVAAPTLVVHGRADPLVPFQAGEATAAAIPEARLVGIDKLGHDLPEPLIDTIADAIAAHVHAVEVSR